MDRLNLIAVHRINLERASTLLELAENQGNTRGWGRLRAAAVFERARLCLNENRIEEAAEYLNRLERLSADHPAPSNCAWSDIHRYTALARAYLASAEERFDDAISILTGLQRELENARNLHFALRVEIFLAIVRFRAKRFACAPAGIYRTILDEGAEVGPLLAVIQESAQRTGSSLELIAYVCELVERWRSRYQSETVQTTTSAVADLLSARETDILKLIAEGLSNKEIARDLVIAPETVKSHVKNIFAKLNVEKRAQAVSRAQSLGLAGTQSRMS
jgi:LuxR family transcriptional regulator, maltose regulon positive regulatory protein